MLYNNHNNLKLVLLVFFLFFYLLYFPLHAEEVTTDGNISESDNVTSYLDNLTDTVNKLNDSITSIADNNMQNLKKLYTTLFGKSEEEKNQELEDLKSKYNTGGIYIARWFGGGSPTYYTNLGSKMSLDGYGNLIISCVSGGEQVNKITCSGSNSSSVFETNSYRVAHYLYVKRVWNNSGFQYRYTGFGNPFREDGITDKNGSVIDFSGDYPTDDDDYNLYKQLTDDTLPQNLPYLNFQLKVDTGWWEEYDRRGYNWFGTVTTPGGTVTTPGGTVTTPGGIDNEDEADVKGEIDKNISKTQTKIMEIKEDIESRRGFLTYPVAVMSRASSMMVDSESQDLIIDFPSIQVKAEWFPFLSEDLIINEPVHYNFTEVIRGEGLKPVMEVSDMMTTVATAFGLMYNARRKYLKMLSGGASDD